MTIQPSLGQTKPWDAAEILKTPADIAAYLDAYLEDGSPEELRRALSTIARAHGMSGSITPE
jgi:probable addiction module antidote protein